jgi:hypothetical protein
MELTSIIYSSLFVVFSLLGLVLLASFLTSKAVTPRSRVNREARPVRTSNHVQRPMEVDRREQVYRQPREEIKEREVFRNEEKAPEMQTTYRYQIDEGLLEANKIRVIRGEERKRREALRNYQTNDVSRYAVVNAYSRESRSSDNLYAKFSKMSVEYSQTA